MSQWRGRGPGSSSSLQGNCATLPTRDQFNVKLFARRTAVRPGGCRETTLKHVLQTSHVLLTFSKLDCCWSWIVYSYNTRGSNNWHITLVHNTYGKRSIKYKASSLRNQLPNTIKRKSSKMQFLRQIKFFSSQCIMTYNNICQLILFPTFLSRVSTLTRDIDKAILSVCLSVCPSVRHVLVLDKNGLTCCHSFFTNHSSFIKHLHEIAAASPPALVTMEGEQELVGLCDLSNGAISNDLEQTLTLFSRSHHSLTLNISQTATDTAIVTIEGEQETAPKLSNRTNFNDLE